MLKSKQIRKLISTFIRVNSVNVDIGQNYSVNFATEFTTVASTAGYDGSALPVQASNADNDVGIIRPLPPEMNYILVYDSTTKKPLLTPNGFEIFGELDYSNEFEFFISFVYFNASGNLTYVDPADITFSVVDLEMPYRCEFKDLPTDSIINVKSRNIADDTQTAKLLYRTETLNITGTNVVSNITLNGGDSVVTNNVTFYLNGKSIKNGTSISTNSAGVITVNATNLGYDVETTDQLCVSYPYTVS